ncbi:MAG TPA: rhodanese-like domain-containing protein, partial [Longimicrobiales bacterium]|nr:rhodanese-like domain-containing protein [Longimicrobiales bacterium]
PGHGAGSTCGKGLGAVPFTTVGYEKRYNTVLASAAEGEDAFVATLLEGQPEPQMYFARMKRDNRDGPPLLGDLPSPRRLTADELSSAVEDGRALIVDTRLDRSAFMARHIPGSLYAPMDRSFNTAVGSLVVDEKRPLLLIVDEEDVEEAVRDLVRIGYDNLPAFADTSTLERYFTRGGEATSVPEVDFREVARLREEPGTAVLDVRFGSEYHEGHIPGAVNASYTRLPEYLESRVPEGKALLVHCASGARSAVAAAYLAAHGRDVHYVNGDWSEWVESGRPVEAAEATAA